MHFSQSRSAPPPVAHWVKSIWWAQGTRAEFAAPEPIVPDGCVEIILNLADPFADHRGLQPLDLIAGQMTGPVTRSPTGEVDLIGVRFGRAGRAPRFGRRCGNCAITDRGVQRHARQSSPLGRGN